MELAQGPDDLLKSVFGLYDAPAYVRRGLQLAGARERLFRRCQSELEEHLKPVCIQLRWLRESVSDWRDLSRYLASEHDYRLLCDLVSTLRGWESFSGRRAMGSTPDSVPSRKRLPTPFFGVRAQLRSFIGSLNRFNRRWSRVLAFIDLGDMNSQVDAYNRYYLLEKECAMRSPRLAARGFEPAQKITRAELSARFPLLVIPQLR